MKKRLLILLAAAAVLTLSACAYGEYIPQELITPQAAQETLPLLPPEWQNAYTFGDTFEFAGLEITFERGVTFLTQSPEQVAHQNELYGDNGYDRSTIIRIPATVTRLYD